MAKRYVLFLGIVCGLWLLYMTLELNTGLQILIWVGMGISVLGLVNCTSFLHKEHFVEEGDVPQLMDPRATSVYSLRGNRRAVLLIHGFSSNPWLYHKHIPLFEQAGYDVIAPRLPGHGTSPKEFLQSSFTQYYQCVEQHLKQYRASYDQFHVVGISMGGLLTLKLGEEYSTGEYAPTSITTLAAPVSLGDPKLLVVRMLSWIKPRLAGTWDPKEREADGAECWLGYNDLFLPQSYSIAMAMIGVRERLSDISLPHLLIHAKGDKDALFDNVYKIAARTSSQHQEVGVPDLSAWDHSRHSLFLYDSLREPLSERILEFFATQECPTL